MDLRKKTLFILASVILCIIIIFMVASLTFFLENYQKTEASYVTDYSNLVDQNVKNEMNNLDMLIRGWGVSNETYDFVGGERINYVPSNLGDESFKNLQLNFIIITNKQGDIVYG
jgi:sensor domain CHASE-containing protein